MLQLQKMADRLLGFDPTRLLSLNLADKTLEALVEGRRLKARDARRRHLRYLAKLLVHENVAAINDFIEQVDNPHQAGVATFHQLEVWRDRLLAEGDAALTDYLNEYPRADRQQVRLLVRTAQQEAAKGKPPAAYRKLFKVLRAQAELDAEF
jgi:ribosome-associated protein